MPVAVPTFADLYAAFQAEVVGRQASLTDWNEGSVLDALAGGGSVLADEVIRAALARFEDLFVDTASAPFVGPEGPPCGDRKVAVGRTGWWPTVTSSPGG